VHRRPDQTFPSDPSQANQDTHEHRSAYRVFVSVPQQAQSDIHLPPPIVPRLIHNLAQRPSPTTRYDIQVPWIIRQANGHMWNELSHRVVSVDLLRISILLRICVHGLVVDPMRSTGARTTELVDCDPGEDLVIGPGIGICPIM